MVLIWNAGIELLQYLLQCRYKWLIVRIADFGLTFVLNFQFCFEGRPGNRRIRHAVCAHSHQAVALRFLYNPVVACFGQHPIDRHLRFRVVKSFDENGQGFSL